MVSLGCAVEHNRPYMKRSHPAAADGRQLLARMAQLNLFSFWHSVCQHINILVCQHTSLKDIGGKSAIIQSALKLIN